MKNPKEAAPPIPIDNRKDFLLLLLAADGQSGEGEPVVGVTRLQKYLYLLQKEKSWHTKFQIANPYRFEPYDFGPFDAQLYDDLQLLENAGLIRKESAGPEPAIEDDEARWLALETGTSGPELSPWAEEDQVPCYSLTPKGKDFARRYNIDKSDRKVLDNLKKSWNRKPLQDLLKWLYATHPDSATNTVLTHLRP